MTLQSNHDFESSKSKDLIRTHWDHPILKAQVNDIGRPLSYFGLPGPAVQDLLDWRDLLSVRTGVERLRSGQYREEDLERHRKLIRNVLTRGISTDFELLRGSIEDVILDTTDLDGKMPRLTVARTAAPQHRRFSYDLVNLDLLGGIGYKKNEDKQIRALKELFRRQQGTDFILLITYNVRDNIGPELTQYLERTSQRVDGPTRDSLEWYASRGQGEKAYKLKAVVPLFISNVAEANLFSCFAYPPVVYTGTGNARMVHFAFFLQYQGGNLQAFSQQFVTELLELPLISVEGENLRVAEKQHAGFDFSNCDRHLQFLPESQRDEMLDNVCTVSNP